MNRTDADKRVRVIARLAAVNDDEAAHMEEDKLCLELIQAIAADNAESLHQKQLAYDRFQVLCKAALETHKIKFARYCA